MTLRSEDLQAIEDEIDRITLMSPKEAGTGRMSAKERRFTNVVVAMDGSDGANHALGWARWFAQHEEAEVHLVTALGPPPYTFDSGQAPPVYGSVTNWQGLMEEERKAADGVLGAAKRRLAEAGVTATTEVAIGSPPSVISAIAESRKADLVICGAHDASALERVMLGSVADGLKHHTHCSILIAKQGPSNQSVVLTTDGSSLSRSAVLTGASLAHGLEAPARLLYVVPASGPGHAALAKSGYEEARAAAKVGEPGTGRPAGVETEVAYGKPHTVICARASDLDAQLIVMGSRGLGGLTGRLLGSVSNPVSHHTTASVLFVKPEER